MGIIRRSFVLACAALAAFAAQADEQLWKRLVEEPDMVVLMRHEQSAGRAPLVWDETGQCRGENRLTARGREGARTIGEAFARHAIRPAVISSPMCRCRDTAEIAFGSTYASDPELREVATADSARMKSFERVARSMLVAHRGKTPVVFVSHRPNIDWLTMELIDEGDLLVGRLGADGDIEILGKMRADR